MPGNSNAGPDSGSVAVLGSIGCLMCCAVLCICSAIFGIFNARKFEDSIKQKAKDAAKINNMPASGALMEDGTIKDMMCGPGYSWCMKPNWNIPYPDGGTEANRAHFEGRCCIVGNGNDDPRPVSRWEKTWRLAIFIAMGVFGPLVNNKVKRQCANKTPGSRIFQGTTEGGLDPNTWYSSKNGCPILVVSPTKQKIDRLV